MQMNFLNYKFRQQLKEGTQKLKNRIKMNKKRGLDVVKNGVSIKYSNFFPDK